MSDAHGLWPLVPAVHRLRDAELAARIPELLTAGEQAELAALEGSATALDPAERRRLEALRAKRERGPLRALLTVLDEQVAVLRENLEQLYDDQFIETCAPWAVPYIGDLVGYRLLHGRAPRAGSRRAEVAHTIAFRRRKGTASMLEQLARDVTGWNARVVEFFALLATTQYTNHLRPQNLVAPSMRDGDALDRVGTAFDAIPRTLDVRRIATRRGRYNIPNVGIFLWRVDAHRLHDSPATPDPTDPTGLRFRFSPLGNDVPLHTRPETEEEIAHLAEPLNVPEPVSRRRLARRTADYYGADRSVSIALDGAEWPLDRVAVCDLSDDGVGWAHDAPDGMVAVDPQLGRLAVSANIAPLPTEVRVTFRYGAVGDLGGGEYPRSPSFESPTGGVQRVPDDEPTVQDALDALGGAGVVEITDNGRYTGPVQVDVTADRTVELRAANGVRPTLVLTAPMSLEGGAGSGVVLNGLVVSGDVVRVPATTGLRRVRLAHTTLVPGRSLRADGSATQPGQPALQVEGDGTEVTVQQSIVGPLRLHEGATAAVRDSAVDAGAPDAVAFAAPGGTTSPGGALDLESCTVVGETLTVRLSASNSILLGPAQVQRRQEGCLRFSFMPLDSTAPRRYRCQPAGADQAATVPRFTTLRYGEPAYCQLADRTPAAIIRGAEDESEMGVFRSLYQPQREVDLATRLDEYLRVGLEAGVFHES